MFPIHLAHCSLQTLSAMCIENLEGDYYIPGSQPDGAEGIWKEAQARFGFHFEKNTVPLHTLTKYSWVFNCQEATDEAVLLWAKRVQSDYNRKAPKSASAKQKAFGLLKLGGWFFSKISKFSKPFTPKPWTENGPA